MLIPKSLQIGKRRYKIRHEKFAPRVGTAGEIAYDHHEIVIATHSNVSGNSYKTDDVSDTFWHELTHAILHDMEDPLYRDEAFVTEFSKRLNQAVVTARL